MTTFNRRFSRKDNNTSTKNIKWFGIDDHLKHLPDRKAKDGGYICRCPLSHNHKNNDKNYSFVINEVVSNKYKDEHGRYRDVVVYRCLSGCCDQQELGAFFKRRLF